MPWLHCVPKTVPLLFLQYLRFLLNNFQFHLSPSSPITSPHLTSPHLTSHLSPLTSPHLTSPHLTSPHLTSPPLPSPPLPSSATYIPSKLRGCSAVQLSKHLRAQATWVYAASLVILRAKSTSACSCGRRGYLPNFRLLLVAVQRFNNLICPYGRPITSSQPSVMQSICALRCPAINWLTILILDFCPSHCGNVWKWIHIQSLKNFYHVI